MNSAPASPRPLPRRALLLLSAASGVLLCLAFPPLDLGPMAWIALVPLFGALYRTRTARESALCGFVFGAVFFGGYLWYFTMWGLLPWFAGVLFEAGYMALFGLLAGLVLRHPSPVLRTGAAAAAWALVAYLRANAGGVAFNGGDLAFTQHDQLPILQLVSLVGQGGLTFLLALANVAPATAQGAYALRRSHGGRPRRRYRRTCVGVAVVAYGGLLVAYAWGMGVLRAERRELGTPLRVALVQGSVSVHTPVTTEDVARCLTTYVSLNRETPPDTDLTVWPESALPVYMPTWPGSEAVGRLAAREAHGQLLMGTLEALDGRLYNAVRLYDKAGRVVARYHKMDLVVYGEYVPLRNTLPFLKHYPIRATDLTAGGERKVFTVAGVRVAPLVCFEGMFSRPTQEVCRRGAQVVAILTSDTWAQDTEEVAQHSATAALRAVESRRYICRAASTGQSAIINPYGETIAQVPINMAATAAGAAYARDGLTPYHRLGDLPVVLVLLGLVVAALIPPRKGSR